MASRLESIDEFRGFAILLMAIINFLARAENVPFWLKHTPDIGFTVADIVAPMFIFAIGLTFGESFRKRVDRDGEGKTYIHFFTRYMAIAGIGFFLTIMGNISKIYQEPSNWGLLQAIGTSGLITLIFIRFSTKIRLITGIILLALYQFMLDIFWLENVLSSSHGGVQGSISWGAMLILSTVLADVYHSKKTDRKSFILYSIALLLIGLLIIYFVPVSKNRVSFSYTLISVGLSAILFELFDLAIEKYHILVHVFSVWGKNPLLLYVLHIFLLGVFVIPPYLWWYTKAPIYLLGVELVALIGILSWIGIYLDTKRWYFSL
jgi:predicted acyltransferase